MFKRTKITGRASYISDIYELNRSIDKLLVERGLLLHIFLQISQLAGQELNFFLRLFFQVLMLCGFLEFRVLFQLLENALLSAHHQLVQVEEYKYLRAELS